MRPRASATGIQHPAVVKSRVNAGRSGRSPARRFARAATVTPAARPFFGELKIERD